MRSGTRGLAGRTAWGYIWAVLGTIAGKGLGLLTLVVVARILAPGEYGLFAFALVYITYLETIGDLGTGMALVYWPSRLRDAAQVTFIINVGMGIALTALTWFSAPYVAEFFHSPTGAPFLRALAWTFLIKALGNTHDALCRKALRFGARLLPEVGLATVKATIAIGLAVGGFGVWSLVWGQLAGVAVATALFWTIVPWRPRLQWPAGLFAPMIRYGRGIVAVNVLAAVTHHLDAVVVGRAVGATALGFYQIAYRIPEMALGLLVWQAGRVLFPAYARIHAAGDGLRTAYLVSLRYVSLLAGPMAIGLFALAEPLIVTLFGDAWRPAIPVLRALAVYAGLRALGSQTGEILKATGRPGLLAALGVAKAALIVPALLIASRWGLVAIAVAVASVCVLTTMINFAASCRLADVPASSLPGALRESGIASAILALTLAVWMRVVPEPAAATTLFGGVIVGFVVYAAAVAVLAPALPRQIMATLRSRRRVGAAYSESEPLARARSA